ncbi:BLUF domain-containing protein [Hymenobacter sp. UYCo722]|uniref:BLUF domain-containing protein n=1 Tax=Hymenobacter sp. UYCo722 TaxID=3156335 RepID=UPI00339A3795
MALYHLIYQSQATVPFDTPALAALLHQSRLFNHRHHMSGLLLHTPDDRFLQLLEGEEADVRSLYYQHILPDPRHQHCEVLGEGPCLQRSFADWNMGFRVALATDLHILLQEAARTEYAADGSRPAVSPALLRQLLNFVGRNTGAARYYSEE